MAVPVGCTSPDRVESVIFQDPNDIARGQNWQQRIDEALDAVTLLLVIITPSLFRSPPCRAEFGRFLDRERDRITIVGLD